MNIVLRENQIARVFVTISIDQFEVYGGTKNGNFEVETTDIDNQVVVKIPAQLISNCSMVRYELFARNKTTGHEWLILNGTIKTVDRESTVIGSTVVTPDYFMTIPASENGTVVQGTQIITGIKGERGYSAYEVACQQGFEGTADEWLESIRQETATQAVEEVSPLKTSAENAATMAVQKAEWADKRATEAEGHAAQAAIEATDAAQAAKDAKAEHERATTMAQSAAGSAAEAQESALAASNDMTATNSFMHQAGQYADAAAASAEVADQKAKAAETSASDAFSSASQAKVSETNAATSATRAEASATAAAQSEANAADSVGMAEMSLPVDYKRFAHVTTFEELAAMATDLLDTEVWRYPLNSLGYHTTPMDAHFKNLKKVYLEIDTDSVRHTGDGMTRFFQNSQLDELRCYFPNSRENDYMMGSWNVKIKKLYVYSPKCLGAPVGFFQNSPEWAWIYGGKTSYADVWSVGFSQGGNDLHTLAYLGAPTPIKKININKEWRKLQEVGCSFPGATFICFQQCKLNKASVLRIVNNLLTYDAETMTEVPQLTLGIDPTLDGDEEINAALLLAQTAVEDGGKGWSVAVNGFTISPDGTSTQQLHPCIYAKRWQDADGGWIDTDGTRWNIRYGNTVIENWVVNNQLGYEEFDGIEQALNTWGLTEYIPKQTTEQ